MLLPDDLLLPVLDIDGALYILTSSRTEGGLDVCRLSGIDCGLWVRMLSAKDGAAVVWVLSSDAFGRIRLLQSSKPLEA